MLALFLLYERASGDSRAGQRRAPWSTPPTRASCSSTPSSRMSRWRCRWPCSRCGASSGARSPPAPPCHGRPGPADERAAGAPGTCRASAGADRRPVPGHRGGRGHPPRDRAGAVRLPRRCGRSWATVLRLRGGRPAAWWVPPSMMVIATVAWMLYVASVTVGYLAPALGGAIDQVLNLIAGDEGSRELFRSATGVAAPVWEQVVGYGSVAVMMVALVIGLPVVWRRWRGERPAADPRAHRAAVPGLAAGAADGARRGAGRSDPRSSSSWAPRSWPRSPRSRSWTRPRDRAPARRLALGHRGVAARRASGSPAGRARRSRPALVMTGLIVLFMGGAILGIAPWARLPGPYLVAADPARSAPRASPPPPGPWMRSVPVGAS